MQASVFDAVNGIERRYTPVHVTPAAPPGASVRAAAVPAAHAALAKIYPAQQQFPNEKFAASLAAIAAQTAAEHSRSIAHGAAWGRSVAEAIWTWRSGDGITAAPPPFLGGLGVGEWRPTPPAFIPGAVPQFASLTPWVIISPSQFRPGGPPSLISARYTADFNEVKTMGSATSAARSAEQTLFSRFWDSTSANSLWNSVAVSLAKKRHFTLSGNARLLALLNVAMADAAIANWDAKYYYVFWRPITAIAEAALDGNPATIADPNWQPLLVTPPFPEYPSGHSMVSGAAGAVLAEVFGEHTTFGVVSDAMPGVMRSFQHFSAALAEVNSARVFAGIHFRSSTEDAQAAGIMTARYVTAHALLPVHGNE